MKLRDYQKNDVEGIRNAIRQGFKAILYVAPTGSGKTVTASHIITKSEEKENKNLFYAHRRELIFQCHDKLKAFGIDAGIIMAGEEYSRSKLTQVASVDTVRARAINTDRISLPTAKVVIVDECHRSLSPTYRKLIAEHLKSGSIVIGITATPAGPDGFGLGDIYETMVFAPTMKELIKMGYLVPTEFYVPSIPDLTGVKRSGDEYNQADLARVMDKRPIVADAVEFWMENGDMNSTLLFGYSVRNSIHFRDRFIELGIPAAHIDGETDTAERKQIIKDFAKGKYLVLCNYGVFVEGTDFPFLMNLILACPVKSLNRFLQMAGRVMRLFEEGGKKVGKIFDHSGNFYEHGKPEDDRDWPLSKSQSVISKKKKAERQKKEIICDKCFHSYKGTRICPKCGKEVEITGIYVETKDGTLQRIVDVNGKSVVKKKEKFSKEMKQDWYSQLLGICKVKGYKPGWTAQKYKQKFGVWPMGMKEVAKPMGKEVAAYMQHLRIKYAKSRQRTHTS